MSNIRASLQEQVSTGKEKELGHGPGARGHRDWFRAFLDFAQWNCIWEVSHAVQASPQDTGYDQGPEKETTALSEGWRRAHAVKQGMKDQPGRNQGSREPAIAKFPKTGHPEAERLSPHSPSVVHRTYIHTSLMRGAVILLPRHPSSTVALPSLWTKPWSPRITVLHYSPAEQQSTGSWEP